MADQLTPNTLRDLIDRVTYEPNDCGEDPHRREGLAHAAAWQAEITRREALEKVDGWAEEAYLYLRDKPHAAAKMLMERLRSIRRAALAGKE